MNLLRSTLLSASVLALSSAACAQDKAPMAPMTPANGKPLASPAATASFKLVGKAITVKYNAPSMRGRKIVGGLIPYGQVWRTGANAATTLTTEGDLQISVCQVPAGTYTLYTLPGEAGKPWTLIVNKQTGQWGTEYKKEMDLCRVQMSSNELPAPQEVMSISFNEIDRPRFVQMHIKWENTDQFIGIFAKHE